MSALLFTNDKKLNLILLATYIAYFGLLSLLAYTYTVNPNHSWKLWLFQSIPLLILLPSILRNHYRAHSVLCFIILAYFTAYVVEVGSPIGTLTDWIGLGLSIIIFSGAMMSSRGLQRL